MVFLSPSNFPDLGQNLSSWRPNLSKSEARALGRRTWILGLRIIGWALDKEAPRDLRRLVASGCDFLVWESEWGRLFHDINLRLGSKVWLLVVSLMPIFQDYILKAIYRFLWLVITAQPEVECQLEELVYRTWVCINEHHLQICFQSRVYVKQFKDFSVYSVLSDVA